MFRTFARAALNRLHFGRHSAQQAIDAYEAANGHPHTERESEEFEAVDWLISSGKKPSVALRRFEAEAAYPYNDIPDDTHEAIRSWLRRWAREGSPLSAT